MLLVSLCLASTIMAVVPHGATAARAKLIAPKRPHLVTSVKSAHRHLARTPRHFRLFIGRYAHEVASTPASYCGGSRGFGVKVRRYDTRGYAAGTVVWCSDADLIWARVKKRWRMVASAGRGGGPSCAALRRHKVPARVIGSRPTCVNVHGNEVRYRHT